MLILRFIIISWVTTRICLQAIMFSSYMPNYLVGMKCKCNVNMRRGEVV